MNKIISFSLWGSNPRYLIGAIENCDIAKNYYPDWKLEIYYDDIEDWGIKKLSSFSNVKLINCKNKNFISPYFWRFFSFFDYNNDIVLSRDCDSRLSLREKKCVDDWLLTNKKISIIRDHVRHYDFPMLAGMFGIRNGLDNKYYELMLKYGEKRYYTSDQHFLQECIWNDYKNDVFEIGIKTNEDFRNSRNENLPFFVGQAYTENGEPIYPVE